MAKAKPKERDIWGELRKPFAKETVGILPKPFKRDSPKGKCPECGKWHGLPAAHLDYVGHAAVTDRLNEVVGPDGWGWEPFATDELGLPLFDRKGNLWIKLTVNGVTKLGVGDGPSEKEIIGDAIRNGAMRFGIALDLWSKEELESNIVAPQLKNQKPSTANPDAGKAAEITDEQRTTIHALISELNLARPAVLETTALVISRDVESSDDLTTAEADKVIAKLEGMKKSAGESAASLQQKATIFKMLTKLGFDKTSAVTALSTIYGVPDSAHMTSATATELIKSLMDELSNMASDGEG